MMYARRMLAFHVPFSALLFSAAHHLFFSSSIVRIFPMHSEKFSSHADHIAIYIWKCRSGASYLNTFYDDAICDVFPRIFFEQISVVGERQNRENSSFP